VRGGRRHTLSKLLWGGMFSVHNTLRLQDGCDEGVYLSVCPLAYQKRHVRTSCGLVLFCRFCNTLCTSGFVDDIVFSHNGLYGAATGQNTKFCSGIKTSNYSSWAPDRGQYLLSMIILMNLFELSKSCNITAQCQCSTPRYNIPYIEATETLFTDKNCCMPAGDASHIVAGPTLGQRSRSREDEMSSKWSVLPRLRAFEFLSDCIRDSHQCHYKRLQL